MKKIIISVLLLILLIGCGTKKDTTITYDVKQHLYKVVDKSGNYVYILGTIHAAKKYDQLDKSTQEALQNAKVLVTEIPMDFNPATLTPYQTKNSIEECASTSVLEESKDIFKQYPELTGIPNINKYNAMTIQSTVEVTTLANLGYHANYGIDKYLFDKSKKENKKLDNFETPEYQGELLADISLHNTDGLIQSLKSKETITNAAKQVIATYDGSYQQMNQYANLMKTEMESYTYSKMVTQRNADMVNKTVEYLKTKDVEFIAVGVMHVAGDDGIVNQLKELGYNIIKVE